VPGPLAREYPTGPQKSRHFDRKADAQLFLGGIRGDLARGVYIDPDAGLILFREYAESTGAAPSRTSRPARSRHSPLRAGTGT
jgi:hypothetical protein